MMPTVLSISYDKALAADSQESTWRREKGDPHWQMRSAAVSGS
jgi:hypothetical protein